MRNRLLNEKPSDIDNCRFNKYEKITLFKLAKSKINRDNILCIEYLYCGLYLNKILIAELADILIPRSSRVRWKILTLLGNYSEQYPNILWPIIIKWGQSNISDIRNGIACCVLEHVLQYHKSKYIKRINKIVIEGSWYMKDTLDRCWRFT